MTLIMMMIISMTLSLIFLFLNHPLSMGLILFLQTIMMCLISGSMSSSFWFSYVLLLIYLGGMLVLFMYVTSIASNELFFYSKLVFMLIPLSILMIIIAFNLNINPPMNLFENLETFQSLLKYPNSFLLKMYNQPINIITILIASYLFLTLIAVVKIIYLFSGPLRQQT
uniref:NADH-ubiquinone oxidoreductase chain 6 n=1 Tax=Humbertiella nada TaxID=1848995 RepID=A0A172QHK4_9NEOP|nr:NADH dehydrogenase subunit 6 [Humbertiella nada]AND97181.1 NADH dehydrogenase subunit 6 [Humbertiella nada]